MNLNDDEDWTTSDFTPIKAIEIRRSEEIINNTNTNNNTTTTNNNTIYNINSNQQTIPFHLY